MLLRALGQYLELALCGIPAHHLLEHWALPLVLRVEELIEG